MALFFKSPEPKHRFKVSKEKTAITRHFTKRRVPKSKSGRVLVATWNIANLGVQGRKAGALELVAHILKRFDLVAVQEVKDQFKPFLKVLSHMPGFDYVMSDPAGNTERLAFVHRKNKVTPTNLFGEVALRDREFPKRTVRVKWTDKQGTQRVDVFKGFKFRPFDRNPFIGSFEAGKLTFTLVNVHMYFGKFQNSRKKEERKKYARRVLEIYALSRWADRRFDSATCYDRDILLLGDMNVPAMDKTESTYKELVGFGWKPVDYTTKTGGSNLGNDKTYDQMVFTPGGMKNRAKNRGVFDFDKAVFKPLWVKIRAEKSDRAAVGLFNRHVKHLLSDHRPLWVELDTT